MEKIWEIIGPTKPFRELSALEIKLRSQARNAWEKLSQKVRAQLMRIMGRFPSPRELLEHIRETDETLYRACLPIRGLALFHLSRSEDGHSPSEKIKIWGVPLVYTECSKDWLHAVSIS
jgi:hypothetical protein